MFEQITLEVFNSWLTMLRAGTEGAIWLADDSEDAYFYYRCAHTHSVVLPTVGVALSVLRRAREDRIQGVIAVLSAAQNIEGKREDIFWPELGDVPSLLLASNTATHVLADIGGPIWMKASHQKVGSIICRAIHLASLLFSLRGNLAWEESVMNGQPLLRQMIDWDRFVLDQGALRRIPRGRRILAQLEQNGTPKNFTNHLRGSLSGCYGGDVVEILAAATRLYCPHGIKARRGVSRQELMELLRVAFSLEEFESDEMFWLMKQWEYRNRSYPLLADWRDRDPLGVVLNQRYWEKDLQHITRFLGRSMRRLAAFKMDLDNFKLVNETLGHTQGDEAIRMYCKIVQELIGPFGEVYRRGGDEIVALAPEVTPAFARKLCERVRAKVEERFQKWGSDRNLAPTPTASIGLVLIKGSHAVEDIVRLMDRAQKQAKQQGKNQVVCLGT